MSNLGAYWRVFLSAVRQDLANPQRLFASMVQQVLRVLLVVAIYHVAYSVGGSQSLGFVNAMWTIGLCFTFFLALGVRNVYIFAEYDIKSGAVETSLLKPLDWRLVKLLELLGRSAVEFLLTLVAISMTLLLIIGPPDMGHITPLVALCFLLFFVLSIVTAGAMFTTVGMSAFWLNDAKSVYRIVDKMALLFCGTFVPFALLPSIIQQATYFLPFNIYAAPTRIFDPTSVPTIGPMLLSGIVWAVIMVVTCQIVWKRANRKIEVNGG